MVINQKDSPNIGFPYQYFKGEVLTDEQVNDCIRVIYMSFLVSVGFIFPIFPTVSQVGGQVVLPLPPPPVHRISRDPITTQTKKMLRSVPVISNTPDKIIYTEKQINQLSQISFEFFDGSISMYEAIFQLRGGGKFKDISFIVLYIWLYRLQNNHVEGFQAIRPPHQEWMPKGADQRPPYAGGYCSSNSGSSLGLTSMNDGFNELSRTNIQNAYSQIPNLSVEGTNQQVTAWSAAKHIHHSPDFGLDPTKYGMTQKDLDSIAKNGLVNHIRDGGTPPSADYVQALQRRWKRFAEHRDVKKCGIQPAMGKPCDVVKHDRTRIFLAFKVDSRESYTGYRLNPDQSLNHDENGILGKNYKN